MSSFMHLFLRILTYKLRSPFVKLCSEINWQHYKLCCDVEIREAWHKNFLSQKIFWIILLLLHVQNMGVNSLKCDYKKSVHISMSWLSLSFFLHINKLFSHLDFSICCRIFSFYCGCHSRRKMLLAHSWGLFHSQQVVSIQTRKSFFSIWIASFTFFIKAP